VGYGQLYVLDICIRLSLFVYSALPSLFSLTFILSVFTCICTSNITCL